MPEMPSSSSRIRVLVLGDHVILCEAVRMGLRRHFEVELAESLGFGVDQWANQRLGELDLVILIILSAQSVPLELLTHVSPYGNLGQTPLMIIAEEGQQLGPGAERAYRLDFPFTYDELYAKTAEMLSSAREYAGRGR